VPWVKREERAATSKEGVRGRKIEVYWWKLLGEIQPPPERGIFTMLQELG
jgi:hypothetical protein